MKLRVPMAKLQLQSIPPCLRPLVRAYLLGYASAVLPRLLTLVLQHLANRKRKKPKYALPERDENTFAQSTKHILETGLDPCRFPTFCAALVGGSTLLQVGLIFFSCPSRLLEAPGLLRHVHHLNPVPHALPPPHFPSSLWEVTPTAPFRLSQDESQ